MTTQSRTARLGRNPISARRAAVWLAGALLLGLESLWMSNPDKIDLVEHWDRGIERLRG